MHDNAQHLLTVYRKCSEVARHERCISRLVQSELDTTTPGRRGLGRMSEQPARFGGLYRSRLKQHMHEDFARSFEDLCVAGIGAAFAYDALIADSPSELRQRPPEAMFERWVGHTSGVSIVISQSRTFWGDTVGDTGPGCGQGEF
jgi:hypothetical protein